MLRATMRLEYRNREALARARAAAGSYIVTFWHARFVMMTYRYPDKRLVILSSRHRDSRMLAEVMRRLGLTQAWGSSSEGGATGMRDVLRHIRDGFDAGITPDGPRGPRRRVQPGLIAMARLSGKPSGGGAVFNRGRLEGRHCLFDRNWSVDPSYLTLAPAGAILNEGFLALEDTVFRRNQASAGSAIYSTGTVELRRCEITENQTWEWMEPAALVNNGGTLLLEDCTVRDNTGHSILTSLASGRSRLVGCLLDDPWSAGVVVGEDASLIVESSTLNGGLSAAAGSLVNISYATVSGTAGLTIAGEARLRGLLLAATRAPECTLVADGVIRSFGANLFSLGTCPVVGSPGTDLFSVDPLLLPLADNGGPTLTHALAPGSPALDAAGTGPCIDPDGLPLSRDQRGRPRPIDGDGDLLPECDMGAFESAPPTEAGACADGVDDDGDGLTDCADPDCCADPACAGALETDCCNGVDDDCDGAVDFDDPDCAGVPGCPESGEGRCENGVDDDWDGAIDCVDTDCLDDPACSHADPDGDGVPTRCDCAPLDPAVHVPRTDLRVTKDATGAVVLSWNDMGLLADIGSNGIRDPYRYWRAHTSCRALDVAGGTWTEPGRTGSQLYLVRQGSPCVGGADLGTGADSFGVPRPPCW